MNFSRRSFATFASRRPQWTALPRLRRSALPLAPSPFFRPAVKSSIAIEARPEAPRLRAA